MTDMLIPDLDLAAREDLRPVEPWPPTGAVEAMRVRVFGAPAGALPKDSEIKPAGSKTATARVNEKVRRPDGKPEPVYYWDAAAKRWKILVTVRDSSGTPGKKWRTKVAARIREAWGDEPMDGQALALELVFVLPSPARRHRANGELKATADIHPIVRPDVLKLGRAVEDAMTEVLYADDSAIVDERLRKVYVEGLEREHVEIRVWRMPTTFAELTAL